MKIVIDAGHGGTDPGAIGQNQTTEKDTNLKLALSLEKKLLNLGQEVILTRNIDVYIPLRERSNIANANNADVFISIHCNSHSDQNAEGTEVLSYYPSQLAVKVSKDLSENLNSTNRGNKIRTDLSVLRHTTMPAILVETDFISNAEVEKKMNTNNWIDTVTSSICNSLAEFYNFNKALKFEDAVKKLAENKIINTPTYWLNTSDYNDDYVRELIINFANNL